MIDVVVAVAVIIIIIVVVIASYCHLMCHYLIHVRFVSFFRYLADRDLFLALIPLTRERTNVSRGCNLTIMCCMNARNSSVNAVCLVFNFPFVFG